MTCRWRKFSNLHKCCINNWKKTRFLPNIFKNHPIEVRIGRADGKAMTDMVFGAGQDLPKEPGFPKWWRSIDRWSLSAILSLFAIGILLGLAASVPLALRNDLHPYFYVNKQAFFGAVALLSMLWVS